LKEEKLLGGFLLKFPNLLHKGCISRQQRREMLFMNDQNAKIKIVGWSLPFSWSTYEAEEGLSLK